MKVKSGGETNFLGGSSCYLGGEAFQRGRYGGGVSVYVAIVIQKSRNLIGTIGSSEFGSTNHAIHVDIVIYFLVPIQIVQLYRDGTRRNERQ